MQLADPPVTSAAYALADRALTRALLTRLPEETAALLGSDEPLPPVLVDEVFDTTDPEFRRVLAGAATRRGALYDRLAALGDPDLAVALYGLTSWTGRLRTAEERAKVWQGAAATADAPGWRDPDGLVAKLLEDDRAPTLLPALHSPFPDLVRHALVKTVGDRTAEDELRACRNVLAHGGVETLRSTVLAQTEPPALCRQVAEQVRLACASADPAALLDEAIRVAQEARHAAAEQPVTGSGARQGAADTAFPPVTGHTSGHREHAPATLHELIELMYDTEWHYTSLPEGTPLDWHALLAAHREKRFSSEGLRLLWQQEGCPEELAVEAFVWHRGLSEPVGALHWPMLSAVDFSAEEETLRDVLPPGIASGAFPVPRVLGEVRPARKVLDGLPHDDGRVRSALAAQVARLGADFAPWRALYTLLPRFSGTVSEAVDAALDAASRHRGKGWPKPVGPEFPPRGNSLGRTAWLHLFDRADPATQRAVGAEMDARTIQYLLLWHDPAPELRDHLVQTHGAAVLAGLAGQWTTPADVIEELIRYDDPEVNAALFLYTNLTAAQRRHVLSGRHWADPDTTPTEGAGAASEEATPQDDRLPLTAALVNGLKESARRNWLLPACDSGDPLLCRVLLGSPRVKVHTDAQYLLMLIRLWERHGPGEVRALLDETRFPGRKPGRHPLPRDIVKTAGRALEAADGLTLLRTAQAEAASPAGQAAFLQANGYGPGSDELTRALDLWAEENGPAPVPWDLLLAAHRTGPLHDRLLVGLAGLAECPPEITRDAREAKLRLSHRHYTPRRGSRPPTVPEMLKKLPLPMHGGKCPWLSDVYRAGLVGFAEVLRDAFPARACTAFLGTAFLGTALTGPEDETARTVDGRADATVAAELREARTTVTDLVRTHLGDDVEAWALAVRLMPDFEGTLPELLASAGAIVS